jgi:hypothetical protein
VLFNSSDPKAKRLFLLQETINSMCQGNSCSKEVLYQQGVKNLGRDENEGTRVATEKRLTKQ